MQNHMNHMYTTYTSYGIYIYDDIYIFLSSYPLYTHMKMIICIYVCIKQNLYLLSIQDDANPVT